MNDPFPEEKPALPHNGVTVWHSATVAKLFAARLAAQAHLTNPTKNRTNPHFKSRYADLASTLDAVLPAFAKVGLAILQFPCELDDAPGLVTYLVHESGEFVQTAAKLRPVKSDPQSVGSALSYARRYAILAIAGVVADDDDDGNAASAKPLAEEARPPAPAGDQPASYEQRLAIVDLKKTTNMSDEAFRNLIWTEFGVEKTKGLSRSQAERFMTMLRRQLPARGRDHQRELAAPEGPYTSRR